MKCYIPVVKSESAGRTVITLKSQKEKVDSDLKKAKKRVSELEEELKKVKDESEKALADAKISEEAAIKATIDLLEIEQQRVEQAEVALTESEGAHKKVEEEIADLKK